MTLATGLVVASPSHAAPPAAGSDSQAKAEATALNAKFKFKAGKHEQAAQLFLEAYTLSRKPALLYNAARAFEEAQKHAEAKAAFEQYLALPGLTGAGRKEAGEHIGRLNVRIAAAKQLAAKNAAQDAAQDAAQHESARRAEQQRQQQQQAERLQAAQNAAKIAAREEVERQRSADLTKQAQPDNRRNKWVTYGLLGGATLFTLVGITGQLQAVQAMNDANAMSFAVDNKLDPAQVKTKKDAYNAKVQTAQDQEGSAVISIALGVGLGGWAAYRLLSKDPGASTATAANRTSWRATPTVLATGGGALQGLLVEARF